MHLTYETGISFVLYYASRVSNKKVKSSASKDLFMLYAGGHVIVIVVKFVLKFDKKFDKVFYFKEKVDQGLSTSVSRSFLLPF